MLHSENRIDGKGSAVALGYFDGIHRGHVAVLEAALKAAREKDLTPAVLLFSVHPRLLVYGEAPPTINTQEKKRQLLRDMGFTVVNFDFTVAINYSPNEFIEKILIEKLGAQFVSCGYDFHYGKGGKGNAKSLHDELAKRGIDSVALDPVLSDGDIISATRIRQLLMEGEIERANKMLGTPFSYDFPVQHGDGMGKGFGFPTINQHFPKDFVVPKKGVYASAVFLEGESYAAVTNIGIRPTVGGEVLRSETCILGYEGDLYGQNVKVSLLSYLRGEIKFPCFDDLKAQIARDADKAKIIYNEVMKNG